MKLIKLDNNNILFNKDVKTCFSFSSFHICIYQIKGLNIAFSFVTKVFYKKKKRIFNCSLCYI